MNPLVDHVAVRRFLLESSARGIVCAMCALLLCAADTAACPVCHTRLGHEVRSGILGGDFWFNLFAVLMPFVIVGVIVVWLHRGFKPGCDERRA